MRDTKLNKEKNYLLWGELIEHMETNPRGITRIK